MWPRVPFIANVEYIEENIKPEVRKCKSVWIKDKHLSNKDLNFITLKHFFFFGWVSANFVISRLKIKNLLESQFYYGKHLECETTTRG